MKPGPRILTGSGSQQRFLIQDSCLASEVKMKWQDIEEGEKGTWRQSLELLSQAPTSAKHMCATLDKQQNSLSLSLNHRMEKIALPMLTS